MGKKKLVLLVNATQTSEDQSTDWSKVCVMALRKWPVYAETISQRLS